MLTELPQRGAKPGDEKMPQDSESDKLCDGPFCSLLASFILPSDERVILRSLPEDFKQYMDSQGNLPKDLSDSMKIPLTLPDAFLQHIESEGIFDLSASDKKPAGIRVGTKTQIFAQKQCPFCRLAACALLNSPEIPEIAGNAIIFVAKTYYDSFKFYARELDGAPELNFPRHQRIVYCNDTSPFSQYTGRRINSDQVNIDLVKQWIGICNDNHKETCRASSSQQNIMDRIRLIDVVRMSVVQISGQVKYLALSYVWGDAQPLKLVKANVVQLSKSGSLTKLRDKIPKSVRDAMEFVKMVDQRYLWVDSLCLMQDDPDELQQGILSMNMVYQGAYLTIIAANAPNANAGLPRVHHEKRQPTQHIEKIKPGMEFMLQRTLEGHLRDSVWASRGWTFQEQILSNRTIIFVNDQVYFRCHRRLFSEETWADSRRTGNPDNDMADTLLGVLQEFYDESYLEMGDIAPEEVFGYLFTAIAAYQNRNLTGDSDAINAVMGILQPIVLRLKTRLLQGLPAAMWDIVLLFTQFKPQRIKFQKETRIRRRLGFPSWSWAGWVAGLNWAVFDDICQFQGINSLQSWLDNRTWIVWYILQPGHSVEAILGSEEKEEKYYERRENTGASNRFGNLNTTRTRPLNCHLTKPYPLLIFFTVSIRMKTSRKIPDDFTLQSTKNTIKLADLASVCDSDDSFCGLITLDNPESSSDGQLVELIILSELLNSLYLDKELDSASDESLSEHEKSKNRLVDLTSPLGFYSVMLIEWVGDIYERRGLGEILQTSVQNSFQPGPQWKEIILG